MLTWYQCQLGYKTLDRKFIIAYEIGTGYKLIVNEKSGQRVFICESLDEAKAKAEELL